MLPWLFGELLRFVHGGRAWERSVAYVPGGGLPAGMGLCTAIFICSMGQVRQIILLIIIWPTYLTRFIAGWPTYLTRFIAVRHYARHTNCCGRTKRGLDSAAHSRRPCFRAAPQVLASGQFKWRARLAGMLIRETAAAAIYARALCLPSSAPTPDPERIQSLINNDAGTLGIHCTLLCRKQPA